MNTVSRFLFSVKSLGFWNVSLMYHTTRGALPNTFMLPPGNPDSKDTFGPNKRKKVDTYVRYFQNMQSKCIN